ncbi:MAG: SMI1/KNR4 family protein, partial [Fuerstiella sp.]
HYSMSSDSSLQQLAEMVGAPLPVEYLELLRNYPDVLRAAMRALDDSDAEGTVADVELIADPDCVLELNIEARQESVTEPDGLEFFWPDQLLIIGETGAGDYYCMDVEGQEEGVIQFDHQAVVFEVIADSLSEFIKILEETFSEPHSDSECE